MGAMRFRRHPRGLSEASAQLLGQPVSVALPLQRRDPLVVLVAALVEIGAFMAWLVTLSVLALAATGSVAGVLVGLRLIDRRQVLAITPAGGVLLAVSASGRPLAVAGAAPRDLRLPVPAGWRAPLQLDGRRWWVERQDFPRLLRAREALAAASPTGGGW